MYIQTARHHVLPFLPLYYLMYQCDICVCVYNPQNEHSNMSLFQSVKSSVEYVTQI